MQKLRNRALNLQCDGKISFWIHMYSVVSYCPMGIRQLEIERQKKI